MTHTLFINTQAFGDCILGIQAARRYKQENPQHLVSYCITDRFNLTTNDGPGGIGEVLEVLEKQPWLDAVGVVRFSPQGQITDIKINNQDEKFKQVDNIVMHYRWFSDTGISKSPNVEIKNFLSEDALNDGTTRLDVESTKIEDDVIRIGIAGPLDWNRKLQSEILRLNVLHEIQKQMKERDLKYEITMFGVEMANYTLYQSLQILNRQDLFIAPIGSLIHASAALDVDTITFASVFPKEYDCPEEYSTGWHKTITAKAENHCGSFTCVTPKMSENADSDKSPGNPHAAFGFWPRNCPYTNSKLSCTKTYSVDQFAEKIREWLDDKYK